MKIYNSLTNSKEDFDPLEKGKVGMYVCGPTVYDKGHAGHGRSMVSFDIVRKYLEYKGYEVNFVTNWTDIDDKMINRANDEGISVSELADKIVPLYERDFGALGIDPPTSRPSATGYIDEMMSMVRKLLADGYAYELDDGVYFDTSKFEGYGKLSGQDLNELEHGVRVEVKDSKKNPTDFVLWKSKKEGEPSWTDPEGILPEGRPGWHIECSAMSASLLGKTFDIHAGGLDLTFPHHECEIAQSECCNNAPFANYWMHNGYVNIDGEKMSKSLHNFRTLEDILNVYDGRVVRYALMSVQYRSPINFTEDLFTQAKASLDRIQTFYDRVRKSNTEGEGLNVSSYIQTAVEAFESSMDDDFEISGALAALFSFVKDINSYLDSSMLTDDDKAAILDTVEMLDSVFCILSYDEDELPKGAKILISEREEARRNKDYQKSDDLRDELLKLGVAVEDTSGGTKWKLI